MRNERKTFKDSLLPVPSGCDLDELRGGRIQFGRQELNHV